MDYQLAKELKTAGFPYRMTEPVRSMAPIGTNDYVTLPTLSELVEACGHKVSDFRLDRSFVGGEHSVLWTATMLLRDEKESLWQGQGNTPEEAVARLWLALNKHDN